jgi:hypothetical protein
MLYKYLHILRNQTQFILIMIDLVVFTSALLSVWQSARLLGSLLSEFISAICTE